MTISATTQGLRMGVATSTSRPAVPFDGQVISETDTDSLKVYDGSAWVGVGYPIAVFNETQASGTAGGTATSGSFVKRTLNTTVVNNITGCSIASSVITLPAGSYVINATSPSWIVDNCQSRFRNTSDSTTAIVGMSTEGNSVYYGGSTCPLMGYVTIAATKTFELQMRVQTAPASSSTLGKPNTFGDGEVYASIQIQKVA